MEEIIVVDGKRKHRQISPRNNPELNPCLEEDIQSKQCLERWQNEKDKCELYFENYRLCTRFWNRVRAERKKQGIVPELPTEEERLEVLKKYNVT